jgi:seryl-tRNA synthetase
LRKYLPGAPDFIPFSKELPKETAAQKKTKEKNAVKAKEAAAPKTVAGAAVDKVAEVADKLKEAAV